MMENLNFYQNYMHWVSAIEVCVEQKFVLPSLCLIYSGIDTIAWVAYGDIAVRVRFEKFVSEHMYVEKELAPRPIDLYAARCAVLHTMTPDSKLSISGKAVPLSYAWGDASLEALERSAQALSPGEYSCVHLNDLHWSFRLGVAHFVDSMGDMPECRARMAQHYSGVGKELIEEFNALGT